MQRRAAPGAHGLRGEKMSHTVGRRVGPALLVALVATACGGGGGGGGGTGLRVNPSAPAFRMMAGDPSPLSGTLQISWTSGNVGMVVAGVPAGESLPPWLVLDSLSGGGNPLTLSFHCSTAAAPPGQYAQTIRVAAGDANGNLLEYVDFEMTLAVLPAPTLSATSVPLSFVESEDFAATQVTVTRDARITLTSATPSASWVSVGRSADTLTLSATADARTLAPGPHTAAVSVVFTLDGRSRTVPLPVNATVTRALSLAGPIALEVNASTTDADLATPRGTISSATQSALTLDPQVDVTWLSAPAPVVTGTASNLALALVKTSLAELPNGVYHGNVTLTPRTAGITALVVPVTLTVRLPEVTSVAPVAYTGTLDTDYVVVRGSGFDPGALAVVDSVPISSTTVLSDGELHVVPGARGAGSYLVEVPNQLGLLRDAAYLRVALEPSYAGTTIDLGVSIGDQDKVLPSPANGVVFTSRCNFCGTSPGGTPSTVQRFAYDSGSGTWSRAQYNYPELYDIALTPDESQLIVLTATTLRLVNPATMATTRTVTLPSTVSGVARQLAVMNDGQVLIQALTKAYALRDGTFTSLPSAIDPWQATGLAQSRDGSRAFCGGAVNDGSVPYRYYDAVTDQVVTSSTAGYYSAGRMSRHAERAFASNSLLDHELGLLATLPVFSYGGDLSPDGQRVYGFDYGAVTALRRLDVSNPSQIVELPSVPLPATGSLATDPGGGFVFVVSPTRFMVVDVR